MIPTPTTNSPKSKKYDFALYDTETNGLLDELTKLHCLAIIWADGTAEDFADQPGYRPITEGLRELAKAKVRIGHNIIGFDEKAIRKVYPWWTPRPDSTLLDTLILAKLIFPEVHQYGPNNYKLLPFMRRMHSLKAWGIRLGCFKGEYDGGWDNWSPEMHAYMIQDVVVLQKLFAYLMGPKVIHWNVQIRWDWKRDKPVLASYTETFPAPDPRAIKIEHDFARIIERQQDRGMVFDMEKAQVLLAKLTKREAELETKLIERYGEWWAPTVSKKAGLKEEDFSEDDYEEIEHGEEAKAVFLEARSKIVHSNRKVRLKQFDKILVRRVSEKTGKQLADKWDYPLEHFERGAVYTPIERVQFNPSSRDHIRRVLMQVHHWHPSKFTPTMEPVVDDDILRALPFPEAQLLADYFVVQKRLGALATGKNAWMKVARQCEDGQWRIFGRVNTNGACTGRCTHFSPNMAQVPATTAEYGAECRELFKAADGYELLGFDGQGLELRMLANFVAPWDKGAYAIVVDTGDPHAWTRDTIGADVIGGVQGSEDKHDEGRARSKTTIYAYIYGAGDLKVGTIISPLEREAIRKALGAEVKRKLLDNFSALGYLTEEVLLRVDQRGFLKGLDGRILLLRKRNSAINTLLQSAGAVVMKLALIILDEALQKEGLIPGKDYEMVVNVHDEAQLEVLPGHVETVKRLALECVTKAGEQLRLKCPLRSSVDVGRNWSETH